MTAKRRCKFCKEYGYDHIKILAGSFCNFDHATKWGLEQSSKKKEKASKKAFAEKKRKYYDNDRKIRLREAQKSFNSFIRFRDKDLPCISCGKFVAKGSGGIGGDYDCGHYLTRGGFPELRFEELNAHKQCKSCNGGSAKYSRKDKTVREGYKEGITLKIGVDKVEWLEGPHKAKKYSCTDLKEIELYYKQRLKELEGN